MNKKLNTFLTSLVLATSLGTAEAAKPKATAKPGPETYKLSVKQDDSRHTMEFTVPLSESRLEKDLENAYSYMDANGVKVEDKQGFLNYVKGVFEANPTSNGKPRFLSNASIVHDEITSELYLKNFCKDESSAGSEEVEKSTGTGTFLTAIGECTDCGPNDSVNYNDACPKFSLARPLAAPPVEVADALPRPSVLENVVSSTPTPTNVDVSTPAANVAPTAVETSTPTAKTRRVEDEYTGRSAQELRNDLRKVQRLMEGKKVPYGNCLSAENLSDRNIGELNGIIESSGTLKNRVSTQTAAGYLEHFKQLRDGDITKCLERLDEERLARYDEKGLLLGIGAEGSDAGFMPVAKVGWKNKGWTYSLVAGKKGSNLADKTKSSQTSPDALGFYKQRLDSTKFDLDLTRLAAEVSRDFGLRWGLSGGVQYDSIEERYVTLQTNKTLKGGAVLATQQRTTNGNNRLSLYSARFGAAYKLNKGLSVSGHVAVPLKSEETEQGNKYNKVSGGFSLNWSFGGAPVKGYFDGKPLKSAPEKANDNSNRSSYDRLNGRNNYNTDGLPSYSIRNHLLRLQQRKIPGRN